MIHGRFQSIPNTEVSAFRAKQIDSEKERRILHGMGTHVPGNKKPGQYRGGHHFNSSKPNFKENLK